MTSSPVAPAVTARQLRDALNGATRQTIVSVLNPLSTCGVSSGTWKRIRSLAEKRQVGEMLAATAAFEGFPPSTHVAPGATTSSKQLRDVLNRVELDQLQRVLRSSASHLTAQTWAAIEKALENAQLREAQAALTTRTRSSRPALRVPVALVFHPGDQWLLT